MRWKFPFFGHVLAWFFLNLAVLAIAGILVVRWQWRAGLDSFLAAQATPRLTSMAAAVSGELRVTPQKQWPDVLGRMQDAFGVQFHVCRPDGMPLKNEPAGWPDSISDRLRQISPPRNPPPGRPDNPPHRLAGEIGPLPPEPPPPTDDLATPARDPRERGQRPAGLTGPPPPGILFWVREPDGSHWGALRVHLPAPDRLPGGGATQFVVLVHAPSLAALGVAVDVTPLLWLLGGAIVLSALFWWPFVHMVNRRLHAINAATAALAKGDFDVTVQPGKVSELADLADSIGMLASKLKAYIHGQRRFLGDIAHELCSPLARMEMALGILNARTHDSNAAETLSDLHEDTREMAALVNELLSFSKASLARDAIAMETIPLRRVIDEAASREAIQAIDCEVPETLLVRAHPDLLRRALANVLRNASRHGGPGRITVTACLQASTVEVVIADDGPGVPDDCLDRLFEPFFRPDNSRARDTGGVGLGLAIVQSCVHGCGGSVSLHNRQPHGLEVRMVLLAPEDPAKTA